MSDILERLKKWQRETSVTVYMDGMNRIPTHFVDDAVSEIELLREALREIVEFYGSVDPFSADHAREALKESGDE